MQLPSAAKHKKVDHYGLCAILVPQRILYSKSQKIVTVPSPFNVRSMPTVCRLLAVHAGRGPKVLCKHCLDQIVTRDMEKWPTRFRS